MNDKQLNDKRRLAKHQYANVTLATLLLFTTPLAAADKKNDKPKPADELTQLLTQPILEKNAAHLQIQKYLHARVPEFKLPTDGQQWEKDAATLRQKILDQVVLRGWDPNVLTGEPNVQWLDTIKTGQGYIIRKLRYEALPGLWIPALLYQPTQLKGLVPIVLNPNGHDGLGKAVPYKQIRCINLAKRGMIALNPEWINMGELAKPEYGHNRLAYLDLCGQSGVGVFYAALKRGLDVLLAHPNADPTRTAVTGLSGGGWQTLFFSSLDTRVKVAVPNAGYIGLHSRIDHVADIGDVEQNPCDLMTLADYTHLTALLAPRPALLIYNAKDNCCFPSHRARPSVYDPIRPLYDMYGVADTFKFHENKDPGTHNYERDNRQQLYRFLNRQFFDKADRRDDEILSDDEVLSKEKLTVGYPKDNENFFSLAEKAMTDLPRTQSSFKPGLQSKKIWKRDMRKALKLVLRYKPRTALAAKKTETKQGSLTGTAMQFEIGSDWTVPAVEHAAISDPVGTAILIADDGRVATVPLAKQFLSQRYRVVAADLLMTGEAKPNGSNWQFAQMFATLGERPLGIRVGQLLAIKNEIAKTHPNQPITLVGVGLESSVIAAIAAALDAHIARVVTIGLPASLKDLITKRVKYSDASSLFCFGLLNVVDIDQIIALADKTEFDRCNPADTIAGPKEN